MAEYMKKESKESAKRAKDYLAWLKTKEAAAAKAKEAETAGRIKDFQISNRAFEQRLGKEI